MTDESSDARWLRERAAVGRRPMYGAAACGALDGVLVIAQALLIAWVVHRAIVDQVPVPELMPWLAGLAAVFLLRAGCTWGRSAAAAEAGARVARELRTELHHALCRQGPLHARRHAPGRVASAFVEQTDALEPYYAHYLPQTLLAVVVPALIIATVFTVDLIAGALLLLAIPLPPLFMSLIGVGTERLARGQHRTQARISAHLLDRIRGITTLRLFRAGEQAAASVHEATEAYRRSSLRVLRVGFLSSAALELISAISVAVLAVYVGFSLLGFLQFGPGPELTLFGGLTILLLAPEAFVPLRRFAQHYHDRAAALGAAAELRPLLREPRRPVPEPTGTPQGAPGPPPVVVLRNVHFRHRPTSRPVLAGIDLEVARGERIAIKGRSGAGKSTLLHLVAGFVPPDEGSVLIDGATAPGPYGLGWLAQDAWLFHGTVAENLRLADPAAGETALWEALETADLRDVVAALPEGLDTPLGEHGHGLSGGQARRLALARAVVRGAPLLLLDEPTDGLDEAAAARVLEAIRRIAGAGPAGGRTVIAATHDPALHAWAERCVTLEDGRLA